MQVLDPYFALLRIGTVTTRMGKYLKIIALVGLAQTSDQADLIDDRKDLLGLDNS